MTNIKGPFWRYTIALDTNTGREFHDGVINDPISEEAARVMIKQHFSKGVLTIKTLEPLNYPELTENDRLVLREMLDWDFDYSFGYSYLEDTGLDRTTLRVSIKNLRNMGLVKMFRGGINDDGEVVGGTGFAIPYEMQKTVRALIGQE